MASARRARDSSDHDRYFVEFWDGVVAITAVAMSCEALQRRLREVTPAAASTPAKAGKKARAIDFLHMTLPSAIELPPEEVDALVADLEPYYRKRNAVAHFNEVARTPMPHPASGNTTVETVEFRVEEAEKAVSAMHAMYASLRNHPSAGFVEWVAAHARALPADS